MTKQVNNATLGDRSNCVDRKQGTTWPVSAGNSSLNLSPAPWQCWISLHSSCKTGEKSVALGFRAFIRRWTTFAAEWGHTFLFFYSSRGMPTNYEKGAPYEKFQKTNTDWPPAPWHKSLDQWTMNDLWDWQEVCAFLLFCMYRTSSHHITTTKISK